MNSPVEHDFWTKQIQLEDISFEEYKRMSSEWDGPEPATPSYPKTYARIINPIVGENYQGLVRKFLKHPFARKITVHESEWGWHDFFPEQISPALVEVISLLAEHGPADGHNFEMRFNPYSRVEGMRNRAKILFRQKDNKLVGYEITVHRENLYLFDEHLARPRETIISAIAAPSDYKIK